MKKKVICLLLALVLICGLLPTAAFADQQAGNKEITVYVSLSKDGRLAKDKTTEVCAEEPVVLNGKAAYTIDDALKAFHDAYYEGGAAAGYATYDDPTYGRCLTKLWGDTSGNFGYQLNAATVSVLNLEQTVSDGDHLDACIYQSFYPDNEDYAAFDVYTAKTVKGGSVSLTLNRAGYDAFWNLVMSPCTDAVIIVDGEATEILTDENGKASVKLETAGTHVISAELKKTVAAQSVAAITAPVCVVTVEEAYLSDLILRTGSKSANILPTFDEASTAYFCEVAQSSSNLYLTAAVSAFAPEGSAITVSYRKADGTTVTAPLTSGTQKTIALGGKMGNRITPISVTVGVEGNTQEYSITVNPKKTGFLSQITLTDAEGGENLLPDFDSDDFTYSVSVAPGTDKLFFTALPHAVNAPTAAVSVGETVLKQTGVNKMLNNAGVYQAVTDETVDLTADGTTVTCLTLSRPVTNEAVFVTVIAAKGTKTNQYVIRVNPAPAHATAEEAFEGSGTEADPFLIATQEQMVELMLMVNSGMNFAGQTVKLTADVTLPADWTPIGCIRNCTKTVKDGLNAFSGTFDGGNHTVTVAKGGLPLFGYVENTTIQNLKIYGEEIAGYGLVNNFEGVSLTSVLTIDNVTLCAGTKTLKSGLVGGNITTNGWAANSPTSVANISNCTVEAGVIIGYDGTQSDLGSIAGRMVGTITNCVSDATVQGVNYVGGIVGTRDNSMGDVVVSNCSFGGSVTGTSFVGGIAGGGYNAANDAPNGGKISLIGNTVTGNVTGTDCVGGITGGDAYVAQVWENVVCAVKGNRFNGLISGEKNVGAIIGSYLSLNRYDDISGNTFAKNRGAEKGIGSVAYVDTNTPTIAGQFDDTTRNVTIDGVLYFSTATEKTGCPVGGTWKLEHNRTDDPLGADEETLWKESDELVPVCVQLVLSGTPQTEYEVGDALNLTGLTFTAKWNAGKADTVVDAGELTITGFDSASAQTETVTLSYAGASVELHIRILPLHVPASEITVSFALLGDALHDEDGGIHTLQGGSLTTWLAKASYTLDANATVKDLLDAVEAEHSEVRFNETPSQFGIYIVSVTFDDLTLGELDNGPLSGWMYTVNGSHPDVGVDAKTLRDGDTVIFHYTDDYTKEEGSADWGDVTDDGDGLSAQPTALPFADVTDHWAADAIAFVYQNHLMNGIGENQFAPERTLSRAMLVTILYRMAGEPDVDAENPFTDVAEGQWYTKAILWAAENRLVSGYGNGIFGTGDDVTREQLAQILFAFAKLQGDAADETGDLTVYTDASELSPWAADAMRWAIAAGLLNGRTATELAPAGTATRAEAATILMRFLQRTVK